MISTKEQRWYFQIIIHLLSLVHISILQAFWQVLMASDESEQMMSQSGLCNETSNDRMRMILAVQIIHIATSNVITKQHGGCYWWFLQNRQMEQKALDTNFRLTSHVQVPWKQPTESQNDKINEELSWDRIKHKLVRPKYCLLNHNNIQLLTTTKK